MTAAPPPPPGRAERTAWCLYDFANSSFTTVVVTFVYAAFFTQSMAPSPEAGTLFWSWAVSATAVVVALSSPLLGAMADAGRGKKPFLLSFTLGCVVTTALLAFFPPRSWLAALIVFALANVCYELACVFYNAFLPELSPQSSIGRLSGLGWGLGYLGGLGSLFACLALAGVLDAGQGWNYRASNLLVAVWFLVFSLPFFFLVRDRGGRGTHLAQRPGWREGFSRLAATFAQLRRFRQVVLFLLARLVYNDGLVTIFWFGGIYAAGTFGMSLEEIIWFGIALNVAAGIGAVVFGPIDDLIGARTTVLISLAGLALANVIGWAAPVLPHPRVWLWTCGILVGLLAGPNQAASRSLMGRFVPERHHAEFFGFFAFSGKLTSFAGPLALGLVTHLTGSQRWGIAVLLPFFLLGALLLLLVDEREGIRQAREEGSSGLSPA